MRASRRREAPFFADQAVPRKALRYEGLTRAARPVPASGAGGIGRGAHAPSSASNRRSRRSLHARTRVRLVPPDRAGATPVQPARAEGGTGAPAPARPRRAAKPVMSAPGFVEIASTTDYGPPADISMGWDGTLWAIDASGAPYLLDPSTKRWQAFGGGMDAGADSSEGAGATSAAARCSRGAGEAR